MQCYLAYNVIDGYEVVVNAGEKTYDPQETANYVFGRFPGANENDIERLFEENKRHAPLQNSEKPIPHDKCRQFRDILANLGDREKLCADGTVIPDLRDAEYWVNDGARWEKEKITLLGVAVPEGAILADDLANGNYQTEQSEIAAQDESDRLAALAPEQKDAEL